MIKVFIDGSAGTTGLRIHERLAARDDIELTVLPEELRKDSEARREALNSCDVAFLCLPDDAAREAVSMVKNDSVKVLDTSTAHRILPDWAYGFPELSERHYEKIKNSNRIAVPGCHASGFIACVYPLVQAGVIDKSQRLSCYSLTGYSGGGKKLIAEYEDPNRDPRHKSHRIYGTNLNHKHLPEMRAVCGLDVPPVFHPILGDFYSGMATTLFLPDMDAREILEILEKHYAGSKIVTVAPLGGDEPVIYSDTMSGYDSMRIIVCGHKEQTTVTALFDNLGKGASGAAIECMNIAAGLSPETGLIL